MGVEPNWPLPDRVARLQDIHQGSPLMFEERQRRTAYTSMSQGDRFKAHVDSVVKDLPPTISERQAADKFHNDLKAKLGQVSGVASVEKFNSTNLFSMTVSNEASNSWEDDKQGSLDNIKSPHFKKLLESLNGKTQDQDYDRWLGILVLVETKGLKDRTVKKEYDRITGYDYLKDIKEEDRQAIAGRDIKKLYEYVRDNIMKVKSK